MDPPADHPLQVETPRFVEAQEAVEVGPHVSPAVHGADQGLLGEEHLKGRELEGLVHSAHANDATSTPATGHVEGLPHSGRHADALQGEVETLPGGDLGQRCREVIGKYAVGGAEGLGPVQFSLVQVHSHDDSRSGDAGPLDGGHADTAGADDQHRGSRGDPGRVERGSHAGGHATAHQGGHI